MLDTRILGIELAALVVISIVCVIIAILIWQKNYAPKIIQGMDEQIRTCNKVWNKFIHVGGVTYLAGLTIFTLKMSPWILIPIGALIGAGVYLLPGKTKTLGWVMHGLCMGIVLAITIALFPPFIH